MTIEEKALEVYPIEEYVSYQIDGVIDLNESKRDCFIKGAEWIEEELIVWLKCHINDYIVKGRDIDLMFDDLQKAMEE